MELNDLFPHKLQNTLQKSEFSSLFKVLFPIVFDHKIAHVNAPQVQFDKGIQFFENNGTNLAPTPF
jgi:hypothetical protein